MGSNIPLSCHFHTLHIEKLFGLTNRLGIECLEIILSREAKIILMLRSFALSLDLNVKSHCVIQFEV